MCADFSGDILFYRIYEIEKKLKVPAKYLYPGFEATHWFATQHVIDTLQSLNRSGSVPQHILQGAKALQGALRLWASDKMITGPNYVSWSGAILLYADSYSMTVNDGLILGGKI